MLLSDYISDYLDYILVVMAVSIIIMLICLIVLFVKSSKLKKSYKKFMEGAEGKSLEEQFEDKFKQLEELRKESKLHTDQIKKIFENLMITYQKIGIVKYDAFQEMGGKLSFVLAILNDENDGFLLNSMHSTREGCYTYVKEIIKGESFVVLSSEEKLALEEAKKTKNYME
ncbi:DUF4446 family protein [Anaerocolumna xylanovorans]|uniref:DUF4446 domain-containing protein n=1 Tax=Anaerocolumna xylanovorans DSM 12503 TaxID=1121345 RepID=A0A1M7YNW0_9FIRM|nr:DUF4446 family protein [Anaerocolumna xylanovorans]SHO54258.1 Protein of unknown function [Anaerocolumna xylanovorans DSM 12503]